MTETPRDPSTPRDPASLVVGAIAAQVIGGLVAQMSPLEIGWLMDGLSLSERDAGFVLSVQFLTLAVTAITAIAIAPVPPRFSCRGFGLLAVALAFASPRRLDLERFVGVFRRAAQPRGRRRGRTLRRVAPRRRLPFQQSGKGYGYFQVVWALGSVGLFAIGGQLTGAFAHQGILALIAGVPARP